MKNFQIMNGGQFKKGFTLIELLTVIVILGILALITTPVITNLINNARKNTFKNSAYGIVQAANQYYLNSKLTGENFDEITFIVNNDKLMSENKELSFTGKSPIGSSYVKINSSGEIAMNITDGTYFATKEYDEAGVLITGKEANAVSREELANKVVELNNLLNNTMNKLDTAIEELEKVKLDIDNNAISLQNNIDNNTKLINDFQININNKVTNIENISNENSKKGLLSKFSCTPNIEILNTNYTVPFNVVEANDLNFSLAGGKITITTSGLYDVTYYVSGSSSSNIASATYLLVNDNIHLVATSMSSSFNTAISNAMDMNNVLYLNKGDVVSIRLDSITNPFFIGYSNISFTYLHS